MNYLEQKHAERDAARRQEPGERQPGPVINPGLEVSNWGPFESRESDFPTGASEKLRAMRSPDKIREGVLKLIRDACA